ncbi:MAG: nicotinamide-nucleotide amidohydrolase family protein [Planctomycetia bacterium]
MLTQVPGASAVLRAGWVAYHEEAKQRDLGVPAALLAREGAVSAAVAAAMAEGARMRAGTALGLSTTGVAGPGPWTGPAGAVAAGTAFVAVAQAGQPTRVARLVAPLERELVRRRAALLALDLLRRAVVGLPDPQG